MSTLKDAWKKVGDDIETIGKDLEKSIVKTVKTGAKAVSDWANKEDEDEKKDAPKADVVVESEEKKD
jgi:hypothetical protein